MDGSWATRSGEKVAVRTQRAGGSRATQLVLTVGVPGPELPYFVQAQVTVLFAMGTDQ